MTTDQFRETAESLNPAEQAAAEELFRLSESSGEYHPPHWTVNDFADEARAVVAAVRPHLAAEALRAFADANRQLDDVIRFRSDHEAPVTVNDLLRQAANRYEGTTR